MTKEAYTAGSNIRWGTDSYINYGSSFCDNQEITTDIITGWYDGFIRPRAEKDRDVQLDNR